MDYTNSERPASGPVRSCYSKTRWRKYLYAFLIILFSLKIFQTNVCEKKHDTFVKTEAMSTEKLATLKSHTMQQTLYSLDLSSPFIIIIIITQITYAI